MKRLALFDLDNTLLDGDSDYEWGQFMCERGVVDRASYEAENRVYYEQYVDGSLDSGPALVLCGPAERRQLEGAPALEALTLVTGPKENALLRVSRR